MVSINSATMGMIEGKLELTSVEAQISTRLVNPKDSFAMLILAHGAAVGIDHKFMVDIQQYMARYKLASFSFNFPYMELGKRVPYQMTKPMKTYIEVWNHVKERFGLPQFATGKSYGGRVGSMVVNDLTDCKGLIFLGYPFHPAGNLQKLRTEHLFKINKPMLFLQGTRDSLSDQDVANGFVKEHPQAEIVWLKDGDHSWEPRKSSGFSLRDHMDRACSEMKDFCFEQIQ